MKKPKVVPYRLIAPNSETGLVVYRWLLELLEAHHQDVLNARFILAWHTGWKPDADGHLTLGLCQAVSDLTREIADTTAYDFVILLNKHFWEDPLVTDTQRRALLDHELCHAAVKEGADGQPVVDERGRVSYRIRKHDLEEFSSIAERYGCWKRDLEAFATSLARARGADQWVGFSGLQAELIAVGAPVPIDAIVGWSEAERRAAAVWARTTGTFAIPGVTVEAVCPPHVEAALRANPPHQSARPS